MKRGPESLRLPYILGGLGVLLLLVRFFWPLFSFDVPVGYDAGINRYLFLRYAEAFPGWPALDPWAREHPAPLFLAAAPLLRMGLPVDWLLGWIWSLMPVLLACALAWVTGRKWGRDVGIVVLFLAVLSIPLYHGFFSMFWKTFASLVFAVFAFYHLERGSLWVVPLAFLCVAVHHQTGLLAGLVIASYWLVRAPSHWRHPRWWLSALLLAVAAGLALLLYLPFWQEAVLGPLYSLLLLRGDSAPGGSFPEASYFLKHEPILLLLGALGFVRSLRREQGSAFQLAVLWSLVFIVLRLVFYRRFFLQLDLFLLPFAALGTVWIWQRFRHPAVGVGFVALLTVQASFSFLAAKTLTPRFDGAALQALQEAGNFVPPSATLLALENQSAPYLLGWLPHVRVGAPGLFHLPGWTYEQWEQFLFQGADVRAALLKDVPRPLYLFVSPYFRSYYGEKGEALLRDPCLQETGHPLLRRVVCPASSPIAP
jgi:hypothetical protein